MSGHHANVDKWRRERSIERTVMNRPDLLKKAELTNQEWAYVRQLKKRLKEEQESAGEKETKVERGQTDEDI